MSQANFPRLDDSIQVRLPIALGSDRVPAPNGHVDGPLRGHRAVRARRSPMTGFCAGAHCVPATVPDVEGWGSNPFERAFDTLSGFDPISWSTVSGKFR